MTIRRSGDWEKAKRVAAFWKAQLPRLIDQVVRDEAKMLAKEIKVGLQRGRAGGRRIRRPSQATILARRLAGVRSSQPLVATKKMMRSVRAVRVGRAKYFVGVPRKNTGSGLDLARIAQINEEGMGPIVIKMTPKMRAFLGVLFNRTGDQASRGGTRPGFVVIRVPKRPFIEPTVRHVMAVRRAIPRICKRIERITGGQLGRA